MVAVWLLGTVVVHQVFVALWNAAPNPYWQPQWWFYWCDAWIFVGSIIATYAMARGWNEFWLAWIGVDLVGVPARLRHRLRPDRRDVHLLRHVRPLRLHPVGQGHQAGAPRPPQLDASAGASGTSSPRKVGA
jgi:hypothetical protein